jgi:hypothetical protein
VDPGTDQITNADGRRHRCLRYVCGGAEWPTQTCPEAPISSRAAYPSWGALPDVAIGCLLAARGLEAGLRAVARHGIRG